MQTLHFRVLPRATSTMKASCLVLAALAGAAVADVFPGVQYTNGWVMSKEYIPADTAVSFTIVVKEQGIDEVCCLSLTFLKNHIGTCLFQLKAPGGRRGVWLGRVGAFSRVPGDVLPQFLAPRISSRSTHPL